MKTFKKRIIYFLTFLIIPLQITKAQVIQNDFLQNYINDDKRHFVNKFLGGQGQTINDWTDIVNIFFNISIKIAAIFLVILMAYWGITIMLSNSPNEILKFKKRFLAGILGFFLIIGSVTILEFINPKLTEIEILETSPNIQSGLALNEEQTEKIEEAVKKFKANENIKTTTQACLVGQKDFFETKAACKIAIEYIEKEIDRNLGDNFDCVGNVIIEGNCEAYQKEVMKEFEKYETFKDLKEIREFYSIQEQFLTKTRQERLTQEQKMIILNNFHKKSKKINKEIAVFLRRKSGGDDIIGMVEGAYFAANFKKLTKENIERNLAQKIEDKINIYHITNVICKELSCPK